MKKLLKIFRWSEWKDIETFSFDGESYLLQGKINEATGKHKFRVIENQGYIVIAGVASTEKFDHRQN